jgi:hypothetical protein
MKTHKIQRATTGLTIALGLVLASLLSTARADVKNVWIGVNGATCPT